MEEDAVRPSFILSKVANKEGKAEWKSATPIKTYSKKTSPTVNGCVGGGDTTRPSRVSVKPLYLNDFVYDIKSSGGVEINYATSDGELKTVNESTDLDDDLLSEPTTTMTSHDYVIDMELPRLQETQTIPLPLPLCDVRAEPEELEQSAGLVQDNDDDDDDGLKLGDLAWASVGGYPYWPCVVSNDPDTKHFSKKRTIGKGTYTFYHVTYFGDKGRRSWVKDSCMKRYNGVNTFKALAEKFSTPEVKKKSLKLYKSYTVLQTQQRAWKQAVEEAESLRPVARQERLSFFDKYNKTAKRRSKPRRNSLPLEMNSLKPPTSHGAESPSLVLSKNEHESVIESPVECYTVQSEGDSMKLVISTNNNDLGSMLVQTSTTDEPQPLQKKRRKLSLPIYFPTNRQRPTKRRHSTTVDDTPGAAATPVKRLKGGPKKQQPISPQTPITESTRDDKECDSSSSDHPKRYSVRLVTRASIEDAYPPTASPASPPHSRSGTPSKTGDLAAATPPPVAIPPKNEHPLEQVIADNPHLTPAVVKKLLDLRTKTKLDVSTSSLKKPKKTPVKPAVPVKPERPEQLPAESKPPKKSIPFAVPSSKPSIPRINRTSILFSDVKHDKVCSICFVPGGELYKCKGPCGLFMHPACWDKPRYQLANAERFLGVVAPPKTGKRKVRRKSFSTMSLVSDLSRTVEDDKMSVVSEDLQVDMQGVDVVLGEVPSLSVDIVDEAAYPTPPPSFQDEADVLTKNGGGNGIGDVESLSSETSEKNESDSSTMAIDRRNWKCKLCTDNAPGPCFICGKTEGETIRCKATGCGKDFHEQCLSIWPQKSVTTSGQSSVLICPMHSCHVCTSDNPQSITRGGVDTNRLVRCILCPSTYHYSDYCVTAGSKVLSATQIICPLHYKRHSRSLTHQSCTWCAICCKGGSLICCEYCPLIFHVKCLMMVTPLPEKYICEDCESGRFPVYGEIVWVKLGLFRWWPAKILYPSQIPNSLKNFVHTEVGEFPVRFYGTHDHAWIHRGRAFVYVDGDSVSKMNEENNSKENRGFMRYLSQYETALAEAADEKNRQNHEKALRVSRTMPLMKPPKYAKISLNKLHSSVSKNSESTKQNKNQVCECDPNSDQPCGPDSVCINRLLMVECDPDACAAGTRCQNRCFELRQYPPMKAFITESRGWGLKTLVALKKGDFVIEYVGEMIGTKEYQNRLELMRQNKDENYYFLEIDKERMLDAGPKGNLSRFMNHSCDPNCETQKWTVKGDTRIGLFASRDIPAGSELVFNYNLTTLGNALLECRCGSDNCSGFIGGKAVKPPKTNGITGKNGLKSGKKGRSKAKRTKKRRMSTPASSTSLSVTSKSTTTMTSAPRRRVSVTGVVSDKIKVTKSSSEDVGSEERVSDKKNECSMCYTPTISEKSTICCKECSNVFHLCCVDLTEKPEHPWKCPSHEPKRSRTVEKDDYDEDISDDEDPSL